jgi:hypothetical protein
MVSRMDFSVKPHVFRLHVTSPSPFHSPAPAPIHPGVLSHELRAKTVAHSPSISSNIALKRRAIVGRRPRAARAFTPRLKWGGNFREQAPSHKTPSPRLDHCRPSTITTAGGLLPGHSFSFLLHHLARQVHTPLNHRGSKPHKSHLAHSNLEFHNVSLKMRSSLFLISLISAVMFAMPFLASGFGIHGHARAHNVNRRALVTEVETVTEIAIVTITVDEGAVNAISTPAVSKNTDVTTAISAPAISTPPPSTVILISSASQQEHY